MKRTVLKIGALAAAAIATVFIVGFAIQTMRESQGRSPADGGPIVSYGDAYAKFSYDAVGIDALVVWGDGETILDDLDVVCQYAKSAPFGVAGSHLILAHNYGQFAALENAEKSDIITVKTGTKELQYRVENISVGTVTADSNNIVSDAGETLIKVDGADDELFLYTCYPFNNTEDTDKRLVVYALPVEEVS